MILNNFDMNSKLLFEQHSVLVFGEKSFIKETINICKKINFKSLFISNKFDEVCNLFSKENISIVFLNVESCNLYLIKLRELLAGKNTRYFLFFENITNELLKFNLDEYIFTPGENKTITIQKLIYKNLVEIENEINIEENNKKFTEQQKRFDNIFEVLNNSSLITRTDKEGKIIYANDIFLKTSGYKKSEIIGQRHNIVRHPKTDDKEIQSMWKSISNNEIWSGVVRNISKRRNDFIVESKIIPEIDANGETIGFLAVQYDISDLVLKNELAQLLINEQSSAVLIGQVGKGIISNSKEIESIFTEEEIKQLHSNKKHLLDFATSMADNKLTLVKNFQKHKSTSLQNVSLKAKEKEGIYNIIQKRIDSPIGKYYFITIHDVTKSQQEVAEARLEAAAKSNFLATMSHEIRTPLNGMIPYIDLLLETADFTSEQLEYISTIKNSSESLLRIINDILDFSKIESGKLEIEKISFDPIREFETVIDLFSAKADEKYITLYAYIEPTLPYLIGDPSRIKQIINNLLSNAIKFTPENGEIIFNVENTSKKKEGEVDLYISIKDNGKGISKEQQLNIFTPFSQADNSISRKFGGTGLGLSISQNIANLMGGKIVLDSKLEKGSKFSLNLKLDIDKSYKKKNNHINNLGQLKVCIFSTNNIFNCEIVLLAKYLKAMKFSYQRVERIEDAVDCNVLFILSSGDDSIDFITDDFIKDKRIITILGSTSENTNKYYSHVTLNMPINASKIFDSIVDIEKIHRDKPRIAKHSNNIEKYNAVVLVAEDNPTNQKLVKILLAKHGVKVDIADNGKIAFDKYIESKKEGSMQYDLILMDIHMPIMDGTEAVRNIRDFEKNNKFNKANIVALTADAIKTHQQQYLKSGFDGFLAKPIEIDKFEKVLKKYLSELSLKKSNNEKISNTKQIVNKIEDRVNNICNNLGLDYDISKMLLDDFMYNWDILKKELEVAISKENYDEVRAISHSLKGSAGSLQLDTVYNLCKDMEALAKNKAHKESNDTYKNLFDSIKNEINI